MDRFIPPFLYFCFETSRFGWAVVGACGSGISLTTFMILLVYLVLSHDVRWVVVLFGVGLGGNTMGCQGCHDCLDSDFVDWIALVIDTPQYFPLSFVTSKELRRCLSRNPTEATRRPVQAGGRAHSCDPRLVQAMHICICQLSPKV